MVNRKLSFVQWDITSTCNYNCAHCYAAGNLNAERDLTFSQVKTIIDHLKSPGVDSIAFYGGEPLVRPDIADIIRYCSESGFQTFMITNGFLLDKKLPDLVSAGITGLALSLESLDPERYKTIRSRDTLHVVKKNLEMLGASSVQHKVLNLVMMEENADEIVHIVDYALNAGLTNINFEMLAVGGNALAQSIVHPLLPEHVIQVFDGVLEYARGRQDVADRLNLNVLPPRAVEYFNAKYDLHIPIHETNHFIPYNRFYIDFDGVAWACRGIYPHFDYHTNQASLNCQGFSLLEHTCEQALESDEFYHSYCELVHPNQYDNLTVCKDCRFLLKYCHPCPITCKDPGQSVALDCTGYPIGEVCSLLETEVTNRGNRSEIEKVPER